MPEPSAGLDWRNGFRCSRSVAVVMAYRFEHEAPRVEPEGREVRLRILGKDLRLVHHTPAELAREFGDDGVDGIHRRAGRHHERQVLKAGVVSRVSRLLGRWVEEQVGARLPAIGRYANWSSASMYISNPTSGIIAA